MLIFLILIAILIVVVIIVLFIFWCCRPRSENAENSKFTNIEISAITLEKEVFKTESNIATFEKSVAKLEQTLEYSEAAKFSFEMQQGLKQTEQERLKESTNKLGTTLSIVQENIFVQEKSLMDLKITRIEQSLKLIAVKDEKHNKTYNDDDKFKQIGYTVSSLKDKVNTSENKIDVILSKLETLVSQ